MLQPPPIDVIAIGNAIVDVLALVDEEFLIKNNLVKGTMALAGEDASDKLYRQITPLGFSAGGSAANSLFALASLGASAGYIGRIKDDPMGQIFSQALRQENIQLFTPPARSGPSTARCLLFITPDAQRTMQTYLGASIDLTVHDVNISSIARAGILLVEAYLFDPPHARDAALKGIEYAKQQGIKVALGASDALCIKRHLSIFQEIIPKNVDYLFGNEEEAMAITQTTSINAALHALKDMCPVVVITLGKEGSVVFNEGQTYTFGATPNDKIIDTGGAGDLYAGGFLFGLSKGYPLQTCGEIASLAASEVLATLGPRPKKPLEPILSMIKS
jgi:fructokinase